MWLDWQKRLVFPVLDPSSAFTYGLDGCKSTILSTSYIILISHHRSPKPPTGGPYTPST